MSGETTASRWGYSLPQTLCQQLLSDRQCLCHQAELWLRVGSRLSNGGAEMGLRALAQTMTSPHNGQQTAALAALQVEPADQVMVTPRRRHRPRTPTRKSHSLSAECHGGEIKGASGPEMATSKRRPEVLFYGAREMVQSLFTTVPPLERQLQEGRNLTFIFFPMFSCLTHQSYPIALCGMAK